PLQTQSTGRNWSSHPRRPAAGNYLDCASILPLDGHVRLGRGNLRGLSHTPSDTLDVYVIGKQWMWKLEQPNGRREINELHVPVNRNVRLILASEDIIHDFSVPAFRVKMDVIPGHYNTMWFRPTKAGHYHFFCSQYCGTSHAIMGGWVIVMEQDEYS